MDTSFQDWQQRGGQAWNSLGGWNMQSGGTDAEGRFRFSSLLPGEYRIQMQLADEILPQTTLRTGMPSVTLRLERAMTVRGRVTDASGQPIVLQGGQALYVSARRGDQWYSGTMVGSDGRFSCAGCRPARSRSRSGAATSTSVPANVDVVAGADGVAITLERNPPQPAK